LRPLTHLLAEFSDEISIFENGHKIAGRGDSAGINSILQPDRMKRVVIPAKAGIQASNTKFKNRFTTWVSAYAGMTTLGKKEFIPESGWQIEIRRPWAAVYFPAIKLALELFCGLILVALLTVLIGIRAARRAEKEISHREKLAAIGQMANVISHEMRTALAVIKNSTSYLREQLGEKDPRVAKHLDIIECEVKTSNEILMDILSFSKNGDNKPENVDINALIRGLLDTLPLPETISVKTELANGIPPLFINKTDIKQVLSNLIQNAGDAVKEEGKLVIRTEKNRDQIVLSVMDNGYGIHPGIQKKVFEPFFTTKSQGTGLGLAIVKKIVESHDGKIDLKSREGEGTTVTLRFNMNKAPSRPINLKAVSS